MPTNATAADRLRKTESCNLTKTSFAALWPKYSPKWGRCPRAVATLPAAAPSGGRHGVFYDADSAVTAARAAFEKYRDCSLADRKRVIDIIRQISIDQCEELGLMEMEETKIGRPEHKIEKLRTLGERTPGIEMLETKCFSGDHGLAVIERAPFGVIGAITPVTHSLPTITGNAVSMLAGGNTVVVNPHPSGKKVADGRSATLQ